MSQYIYSRVSTDNQTADPQILALTSKYPQAHVVSEIASGARNRPLLKALIAELKSGDQLIIYALDRLGRRTIEVLQLLETLEQKGVILISLREGVDYSTITGRLVTQILVSLAEMERGLIGERTRAGLASARAKGRIGGRPRKIDQQRISEALRLLKTQSSREVAEQCGISYGYLNKLRRVASGGLHQHSV